MSDSRLVSVLVVTVLVVTAGCTGFMGGDGGVASAEEVRQQAVTSMEGAETYRMQMNMTFETSQGNLSMAMNGTFDQPAEKARMTTTFQGQQFDSYIDGTTMYLEGPTGWQTQNLSDREPWNESTALERQRAIMESANVTELAEDTVDGEPVYVLRIEPDPERVKQVVSQQQTRNLDAVSVENVTYVQYVHRETGNLVRADMEMTMTANGQTIDTTATIRFSDYNEPVDVTIPEEARQSNSLALHDSAVEASV